MPEALYFTDSDEANELIASNPLALLIGFAIDQQVTVQQAFQGPLRLKQRIGTLDAADIAAMDPEKLEEAFRERPAIHRFPRAMAHRVQELCAVVAEEYGGRGRAHLERGRRRRRPAQADRRASRLREDEDHGARLGARPPLRSRGGFGARARPSVPRRSRLGTRRSPTTRRRSALIGRLSAVDPKITRPSWAAHSLNSFTTRRKVPARDRRRPAGWARVGSAVREVHSGPGRTGRRHWVGGR